MGFCVYASCAFSEWFFVVLGGDPGVVACPSR